MSKNRKKIVAAIQGLGAPVEDTVMSGYVKTIDENKAVMSVVLNTSGQLVEGVLLHALGNSLKGFVVIPEPDSDVVICSVDGSGEYMLLQVDKIKKILLDIDSLQAKVSSKIEISCDNIVFNGGENGGMVKVTDVVGRLNDIETKVNDIISVFFQHTHKVIAIGQPVGPISDVTLPAPILPAQLSELAHTLKVDLENPKIKH